MRKLTNEEFIEKAILKHGKIYDYSLTTYINNKNKVEIICSKHGIFEQEAGSHLKGYCCLKCGGFDKTTEEFVIEANDIHGDKYNYSKVNYINAKSKVKIFCQIHGEFEQTPYNHIRGNGCYFCKESKGEKEIRKYFIENKVKFIQQYRFNQCRDIKPLPFDFYLPELNMCVEFNGLQHYEPINHFGGIERLLDQQRKDLIKTKYCEDNKIKLIKISYKDEIQIELNKKIKEICHI